MSLFCSIKQNKSIIIASISDVQIEKVRNYAVNNEITVDEYVDIFHGKKSLVGDREEHVYSNEYFKFVFSIDHLPKSDFSKIYVLRHLSVSRNCPDRYPSIGLIQIISKNFGFKNFEECDIKIKKDDPIPNIDITEIISEKNLSNDESEKLKFKFTKKEDEYDDIIIGSIVFDDVKTIKEYAYDHEINLDDIVDIAMKKKLVISDRKEYTYNNEYLRFVFVIENKSVSKIMYKIKKLVVTLKHQNYYLSVNALKKIGIEFDFPPFEECLVKYNNDNNNPEYEFQGLISQRILNDVEFIKFNELKKLIENQCNIKTNQKNISDSASENI